MVDPILGHYPSEKQTGLFPPAPVDSGSSSSGGCGSDRALNSDSLHVFAMCAFVLSSSSYERRDSCL